MDDLTAEILAVLEGRGNGRVVDSVSPEVLRQILDSEFDFRNPLPLGPLRERVSDLLRRWTVQVTGHATTSSATSPSRSPGLLSDGRPP